MGDGRPHRLLDDELCDRLDETAPEACALREVEEFFAMLQFEETLRFAERDWGEFRIEFDKMFMTPYERQARFAEMMPSSPVSRRRQIERVAEIRRDQGTKDRERRRRIFAQHRWVEVPNRHPNLDA